MIDRTAIDESSDHVAALAKFVEELHKINVKTEDPSDEQLAITHHLEWCLNICRDHHRNLVHVYSLTKAAT